MFGVTRDPFIVYTSNIFAILSLRALYGFVATVMSELRYLDKSVALVLGFIGAMILSWAGFAGWGCGGSGSELGTVVFVTLPSRAAAFSLAEGDFRHRTAAGAVITSFKRTPGI